MLNVVSHRRGLALSALALGVGAAPAMGQTFAVADYFPPLTVGNGWTYDAGVRFGPGEAFTPLTVSLNTPAKQAINGKLGTLLARTSTFPGDVGDGRYFAIDDSGLFLLREDFSLGVDDFEVYDTPMLLLPADVTAGQDHPFGGSYTGQTPGEFTTWTGSTSGTISVIGMEQVTTPAGTFDALRIDYDTAWSDMKFDGDAFTASGTNDESWWLAEGLGIVKMSVVLNEQYEGENPEYVEFDLELTSSSVFLPGDFNRDTLIDAADIDALFANLGGDPAVYDVNSDTAVDAGDVTAWVTVIKGTGLGDVDLDGDVDDFDLLAMISGFTGSLGAGPPASWATGNTDGDADVDDFDLLAAISGFTGSLAAPAPEPGSAGLLGLATLALARRRRR